MESLVSTGSSMDSDLLHLWLKGGDRRICGSLTLLYTFRQTKHSTNKRLPLNGHVSEKKLWQKHLVD